MSIESADPLTAGSVRPAPEAGADALRLDGVSVTFGGAAALPPATWTLPRGCIGVISGPAGAGKSTLLEVCALARRPDVGAAVVLGEDPDALDAEGRAALRRRIGWAPQSPRFLDHLDLAENLAVPLRLGGVSPAESRGQAEEVLDWLGLSDQGAASPRRLSLGERRRAALARAVIAGPELVLADDPVAGLDAASADQVLQLLRTLSDHGAAVAATSADPDLARGLGGRARTLRLPQASSGVSEAAAA